jgi:hypothetical protein
MKIRVRGGLPYITVSLNYRGKQVTLEDVLLDTGSSGTIFSTDKMDLVDIFPEPEDTIYQIRGVGGTEFAFAKRVDRLRAGDLQVEDFYIEVGAMKYGSGFEFDGIIGLDFLIQTKAVVDLSRLELYSSGSRE